MQFQPSLFDSPTEAPKTLGVLTIEWDSLCYQARCCLGNMVGNLQESFIKDVLAKQNADEVYDFIKFMLQDNVERRSNHKVTLGFTPSSHK